jgi:hypothetical protein
MGWKWPWAEKEDGKNKEKEFILIFRILFSGKE